MARCPILVPAGATPTEIHAARELAHFLGRITGARYTIRAIGSDLPDRAIVLGTRVELGPDELVIRTRGSRLFITGGRPRGALNAVYRFLHTLGCRWWSPWASTIPRIPELRVPDLSVREKPAFAWRSVYWRSAMDREWAARNLVNGTGSGAEGELKYEGFVHTFYKLVPPEVHFKRHPEWFSLVHGRRVAAAGQLCLTNPELRTVGVRRVREWLARNPDADVVSVSQNDGEGACECGKCSQVDMEEGSPSGTLLRFVNAVAEEVEKSHPRVLIDTLAYQHTRRPPRLTRPRRNVVVRLCSIECDFRTPFDSPTNAAFARDLEGWSALAPRLHAWDYTTNLEFLPLPHPNWLVLGDNLRALKRAGVESVFEQGGYVSHGAEMEELRSWVLAQLLWDPQKDTRALVREFVQGYYGQAAPHVLRYLDLMHEASSGFYLGCYASPDRAPFLRFPVLTEADAWWDQAEAAATDPDQLRRVRQARQPVRFAFLIRWHGLRRECREAGATWPLPKSRREAAEEWLAAVSETGPDRKQPLARVGEWGLSPRDWVSRWLASPEPGSPSLARPSAAVGIPMPLSALLFAALPLLAVLWLERPKRPRGASALSALTLIGAAGCYLLHRHDLTARPAAVILALAALAFAGAAIHLAASIQQRSRLITFAALIGALAAFAYLTLPFGVARFRGRGAELRGANLRSNDLSQCVLDRAHLQATDLRRAKLQGAWLGLSDLTAADLRGASLQRSSLNETVFHHADLRGADLSGAAVADSTRTNFAGARYDRSTRWPEGFDPGAHGAVSSDR